MVAVVCSGKDGVGGNVQFVLLWVVAVVPFEPPSGREGDHASGGRSMRDCVLREKSKSGRTLFAPTTVLFGLWRDRVQGI